MKKRKIVEALMKVLFGITACASILAVFLICLFMFMNGLPAIGKIGPAEFLGSTTWAPQDVPPKFGILTMIVGSLYVTAGAIIVGLPVGLLTAVFLARFCPKGLYKVLKPLVELLAGIPSIVYGFFGMVVLVPLVRELFGGTGNSILTASLLLGVMILPTIIGLSEAALRAVDNSYYEGALALGATHERAVFFTVLPAAKSGVLSSVILGIGRAIGETMAIVMIVGNQTVLPTSVLDGVRTLTVNIVLEMSYAAELHREALIATGVVLFVFILILNLCFSLMNEKRRA
ncbi:MAG: phosphate ABC transporter permease subunit PstC [Christensenellales bacterium]|jgi:phosphate transport system permease protein